MIKYIVFLVYLYSTLVFADTKEKAKEYLNHNVPNGIYSEFTCPQTIYTFGDKRCTIICKESDKTIFEIVNVRIAYYSRSSDRVAIVIDTFENSNIRKGIDSYASLSSTVSCFFNQLKPI